MSDQPARVLLLAQTPPPIHGQALMMQLLLKGSYDGADIYHVRMSFSRDIEDVGRIRIHKIGHLFAVMIRVMFARLRHRADILYYPPAGPHLPAVMRDIALLVATRWMFRRVIFHFEASGLSSLYPGLPGLVQWLFRRAYFHPFVGIKTSRFAPDDPRALRAVYEVVIPNVPNQPDPIQLASPCSHELPTVLFVGALRESKGVEVLLEAAQLVFRRGMRFRLRLVGRFESRAYESAVRNLIAQMPQSSWVELPGVLVGEAKVAIFREADMFCLPSFYESESSPVVLVEAMQFGLPIVATRWRGIPDMVDDGVNGLLVPIKDPKATAEAIQRMLSDPDQSRAMGRNSRNRYEQRYTTSIFYRQVNDVFNLCRRGSAA